jgi:hypothetical protein
VVAEKYHTEHGSQPGQKPSLFQGVGYRVYYVKWAFKGMKEKLNYYTLPAKLSFT